MSGFYFPNGDVRVVYDEALEAAIAALSPLGTVWDSSAVSYFQQRASYGMDRINMETAVDEMDRFRRKAERREAAAAVAAAAVG